MRLPYRLQGQKVKSQGGAGAYCGGDLAAQLVDIERHFCLNVCQIGAFFMINLCLVVIATQFSETKKRETERMAVERARHRRKSRSSSTVTSRVSVQPSTAGCYDELLAFVVYLVRLAQRRAARLFRLCRRRCRMNPRTAAQPGPQPVYAVTRTRRPRKTQSRRRTPSAQRRTGAWQRQRPAEAPCASPELSDIDLTASPRRRQKRPTTTSTSGEHGAAASMDLLSLHPTYPGILNDTKLSCRRQVARCFVSSNISLKVIRNETLEQCTCKSLYTYPVVTMSLSRTVSVTVSVK